MLTEFQRHFTKIKVESSETPMRTGTVSVNCSVYCHAVKRWPNQKSLQISAKYQQLQCLSESDSCRLTVQCPFSVICGAITQELKVQDQHDVIAELQYCIMLGQFFILFLK